METAKIYELSDPNTGVPRYIGYTKKTPEKRLEGHLYGANYSTSHKNSWIKSLNEKTPIVTKIDEIPLNEWEFWEKYYISLYKSWGFDLLNWTDGGKCIPKNIQSKEAKKKSIETRKKNGKKKSKEAIEKTRAFHLGRKRSEETCRNIGLGTKGKLKGVKKTEEHKKKIGESNKGKVRSEEYCKKLSEIRKGKPAKNRIQIVGINLKDSSVRDFGSLTEAVKLTSSCVSDCLSGRIKKSKGWIFFYKEDYLKFSKEEVSNLILKLKGR